MADNTGITYNNMRELENKADKFFELAAKVEEYLRQTDDIATAIGYQKIWEAINTYHKRNDIALDSAEKDVDDMIEAVSQLAKEIGSSKNDPTGSNPGETFDGIWFKIPGFN
jgi:chromosome segregation ATPase